MRPDCPVPAVSMYHVPAEMWGRLGVLLQRGNAAILANRVPSLPAANIDRVP